MAERGFHFFQRTDRHRGLLLGKEKELELAIRKAVRGVGKSPRIRIEPSHFHVFCGIDEKKKRLFASRVREEISGLEGIRWDSKFYMIPLSTFSKRYVEHLIEDMHKEHLF